MKIKVEWKLMQGTADYTFETSSIKLRAKYLGTNRSGYPAYKVIDEKSRVVYSIGGLPDSISLY